MTGGYRGGRMFLLPVTRHWDASWNLCNARWHGSSQTSKTQNKREKWKLFLFYLLHNMCSTIL